MNGIEKNKLFYNKTADAPLIMREFGFYSLDRWKSEGYIDDNTNLDELFGFDESGVFHFNDLGWCEAAFAPEFDVEILEDRGEHEVVRDVAGRHVLYFKGRRNGFMPEYIDHPVKDLKTWKDDVKWRLNPYTESRYKNEKKLIEDAKKGLDKGMTITQHAIGGFMYLRSLMGAENLLLAFYDQPELIEDCMQTWLELNDAVIASRQKEVPIDELFLAEDICYNVSSLISHDMMREFLFPYYQQLIANIKRRQPGHHLNLQIDSDGKIETVIDVYKEIGINYFSPFEVASGSDVVAIGEKYPDILMLGGFDKRIIAKGKDAIDREVDRIMPVMKKRGGYIPTCDHGVPEEVSFENYVHFRKRLSEFGK